MAGVYSMIDGSFIHRIHVCVSCVSFLQDIVPMEQVSSMVSNGGGSVAMQRDDEYRNRIMKSKCVVGQPKTETPC